MGAIPSEIIGRNAELDAIDACLDRLEREAAAIVFEGQAGIGKTTLLAVLLARLKQGGALAGRAVCPGKALVLSEGRKNPLPKEKQSEENWRLVRHGKYIPRRAGRAH